MEQIILFTDALIELSNAMAPYILFGLFFAGILHELVPETLVTKHLGKESIASVVKATLFGIPLPVCSCGGGSFRWRPVLKKVVRAKVLRFHF